VRLVTAGTLALLVAFSVAVVTTRAQTAQQRQSGQRGRAVPRADASVPFKVGETLTYDVTWSSLLVAGSATARVGERRSSQNSTAYHIVAEGRPVPLLAKLYNLYYKMDTLLDTVTLLPQQSALYSENGARKRTATSTFHRLARLVSFEVETDTTNRRDFQAPPQAQDGLAALYVLRTMGLKAGDSISLPVTDDGSVYSVTASIAGPEGIRVPFGELSAWAAKLEITDAAGKPAARNAAVWISNDARRLPLRLQAELPVGNFVLVLRSAN
jgi:hypothetical protein